MKRIIPAPKGDIVKEYLRRFPSTGSRKIAALIMRDVPGLFKDEDTARSAVRYYRGSVGSRNRRGMAAESFIPRVTVPEGEPEDFEPYLIPEDGYPIIVGSDAHIPYHDSDALEIFIERAVEIEAKTVLLLGDWLDFYLLSRFVKDPRKRRVNEEIATFKAILGEIRKALPKAHIIYKYGNHDERWDIYLMQNAPALFDVAETHLDKVLGLEALGVEVVQNKRVIRAGHLNLIHGHEYIGGISQPVNPARGLYLRAKKSAICGHFHQSSDHTETSINGDVVTCWSLGCLCGLHPQYMPLNKWNLGMGEIYKEGDFFRVANRKIIEYRLL